MAQLRLHLQAAQAHEWACLLPVEADTSGARQRKRLELQAVYQVITRAPINAVCRGPARSTCALPAPPPLPTRHLGPTRRSNMLVFRGQKIRLQLQ